MEIREIHIDGFGVFRDFSLNLPGKGIHIILGNNEAGKSTLLKFLRFTLFGYPRFVEQRMAPLHGGNHGGRIKAHLSSGAEAIFERDGRDRINLQFNGAETSNISQWSQLLSNASSGLYNNVYAFTLDELSGLSSIKDSGMEDKIFSLGLGLGNISISQIENTILNSTDEIYKARGKSQLIPALLKDIEEKHAEIKLIQDNLDMYRQLTADIEILEEKTKESIVELNGIRQEFNTLDAYLRCYDSFVSLSHADAALKQLKPLETLPANGVQILEKALETLTELNHKNILLENGDSDEKGIGELNQMLKDIEVNVDLLQQKEKAEYIRRHLEGYKQTVKERVDEGNSLNELNDNIAQTIAGKINPQWGETDVVSFNDILAHQSRLEEFVSSLQKIIEEKRDWEAREKAMISQKGSFNTSGIAKILALLFLLGAIPPFYYGIYLLGGVLLVIALVFFLGRKAFVKSDPLIPVRKKIKEILAEEQSIISRYRSWLQKEMRLSPALTFQAVGAVFQNIEHVKSLVAQRDRLRKKIQEDRLPYIYDFDGKVSDLKQYMATEAVMTDSVTLAVAILNEFDQAESLYSQIVQITGELKRKNKEKQGVETKIQEINEVIKKLLEGVSAKSTEEFFQKYADNEKVKSLDQIRQNAIDKIETVAGINKATEVITWLQSHDKLTLETLIAELKNTLKEKEQFVADLHKERGSKTREKERIASESDLAQKLTQLESFRQKLREFYMEWLSGQVAIKILSQVKASYEHEKQPAVIKNSGNYFHTVTAGQYTGIRASLEGREVSVFDQREASRTIDQLSRGTKEQLLVSLRLGFIQEYEKQAEPLPVIVDEILVNFDPTRARNTAKILQEFAATRQLLLFTCHPSTIDIFDKDKVNVLNINEAKAR